ncbi:MAG TPA: lysophospholipid acyltransferase family protein [Longimicrobiaceae bacterium]
MIRSAWVGLNIALATLFFGTIVIVASLLGVRGRLYFWATQQWSRVVLWASNVSVTAHGIDRVDWNSPHVLVCNHVSFYDVFALASILPTPFAFVAKKELARIPFFGIAWRVAGHISIDRSDRASAIQSLRKAGESIREHRSTVIIFPEGTRSLTGQMLPFKKGAFNLAIEARVPILPVVVIGSADVQRPGSLRVRSGPIHLYFGEPMPPPSSANGALEPYMASVRRRMEEMLEQAAPARA